MNGSTQRDDAEDALGTQVGEPIAVIGMACRFPGGVDSPDKLWRVVRDGGDAVGRFPTDRGWNLGRLVGSDVDRTAPGTSSSSAGGFLYNAADFDAGFFNVSPREAKFTDPQHRIMLELAWEAIERGQLNPANLDGSATGVFIGQIWDDYGDRFLADLLQSEDGFGEHEGYYSVGNARGVLSGRISYLLGLTGPAITLDTSCSSSLVALHLAMQSLRSRESSLALAGGITVMSSPSFIVDFSRQGAFSPDGRSKAFASDADGTGVGEGGGLLLLQRLSDAVQQKRPIAAVIRGSALNQDGRSDGQIAPSQHAQERVILAALANAGLHPNDISVVDAHGTGTPLGDSVEAQALLNTYGRHHSTDQPLWIGSLKSNFGHSQAAAGVGSIIKMIMAMRAGVMPKSLHVNELSPKIEWARGGVRVLQDARVWEQNATPRRAAVSSFGISGTNAHVIVEQYIEAETRRASDITGVEDVEPRITPLILSAKSPESLRMLAARLVDVVSRPTNNLTDVAWSLMRTRALHDHRAIALSADRADLVTQLEAIAGAVGNSNVSMSRARPRKPIFVFPGQGAQWISMGKEMLAWSPVFAERLRECDQAFAPFIDWSVISVVSESVPDAMLERVDVVQPCLFAMMVSLDALWRSFGVEPGGVIGHSQGEIAALCTSGAISLEHAAQIVAIRSQSIAEIAGEGAMASIWASVDEVAELVAGYGDAVEIAVINSAQSVVAAGAVDAVDDLLSSCASRGIESRKLPVSYASHSSLIEPLAERLRRSFTSVISRAAGVPVYSSLTGGVLDTGALTEDYWYENLRRKVDFQSAVLAALDDGFDTFVEVSPHPVLIPPIEQIAEDVSRRMIATGTLRRNDGGVQRFLKGVAALNCAGVPVNWDRCFDGINPEAVDLPTYPFLRKRYWVDPPRRDSRTDGPRRSRHPIMSGIQTTDSDGTTTYDGAVSERRQLWLVDHTVLGQPILPGTAFLEIAMFVCADAGFQMIDELTMVAPIVLPRGRAVHIRVTVARSTGGGAEIAIRSTTPDGSGGDAWELNAVGVLSKAPASATDAAPQPAIWPPRGAVRIDVDGLYEELRDRGYEYGPAFRGIEDAWISAGAAYVQVQLPDSVDDGAAAYEIHPAVLDAGLQLCATSAVLSVGAEMSLPFCWQRVTLPRSRVDRLRVTIERSGDRFVSVAIADENGTVATIGSLSWQGAADSGSDMAAEAEAEQDRSAPLADVEISWDRPRRSPLDRSWPVPKCWTFIGEAEPPRDTTDTIVWAARIESLVRDLKTAGDTAPPLILYLPERKLSALKIDASPTVARDAVVRALAVTQQFLRSEFLDDSYLAIVTYGAVDSGRGDLVDPASAAVWGLACSIQRENPARIVLIDIEQGVPVVAQLRVALATGSAKVAVRQGKSYLPSLRPPAKTDIDINFAPHWQLVTGGHGLLDEIVAEPRAVLADLRAGEVAVSVRAAGIAFRDVMIAHNIYPKAGPLGREVAGVVTAVGSDVDDLSVGDRVFGLCSGAFADSVLVDHRHLARMPDDWSFAESAAIPVAHLTAYHALVELAKLKSEDSILIHSAASGTGMAAVYLAQHIGAEVFVTASPNKHHVLREMGIAEDHIASSRSKDFAIQFLDVRNGRGFDVALDAFTGPMVDATLSVMNPGATFIEIGWRDLRNPADVASEYDGVVYQAVDMTEFESHYYRRTLSAIIALIGSGGWQKLPTRCWDVRHCRVALRFISAGRQVGKHVLVMPKNAPRPSDGTVVVSGGTGMAGAHTARHLVRSWGCRSVALVSRGGADSIVSKALCAELSKDGAEVYLLAGDVSDEAALSQVLEKIPSTSPVIGVVHAAGVLDDVLASEMTPAHVDYVFAPKAFGAWNLHRITQNLDLSFFVLYSSIVGPLGSPGQANYGAANAYMDGLALHRASSGMPAKSTVWGLWEEPSSLTASAFANGDQPLRRLGILGFNAGSGLRALDRAMDAPSPVVLCAKLDPSASVLGSQVSVVAAGPPIVHTKTSGSAEIGQLEGDFVGVMAAVNREMATTLGLESLELVDSEQTFRSIGFDSLTAVELRNRLNVITGLRLPTYVVFDCGTPQRLAELIAGHSR